MDNQKSNTTGGLPGDDLARELVEAFANDPAARRRYSDAKRRLRRDYGHTTATPAPVDESAVFTAQIAVQDTPVIRLPVSIQSLCNSLQNKFPGMEFSVLLKGDWTKHGFVVETDAYAIPKQTITATSVDYDPEDISRLMADGYNCVLHSHPMSLKTFSRSDESTINVNFVASVLYCQGAFPDARVCISPAPRLKLRLHAVVELALPPVEIVGVENISRARGGSVAWEQSHFGYEPASDRVVSYEWGADFGKW